MLKKYIETLENLILTEKALLPPIKHVEAEGYIVEMDLAADPIHR